VSRYNPSAADARTAIRFRQFRRGVGRAWESVAEGAMINLPIRDQPPLELLGGSPGAGCLTRTIRYCVVFSGPEWTSAVDSSCVKL
jgi:hypothetical protein